jgi:hypothetical protein
MISPTSSGASASNHADRSRLQTQARARLLCPVDYDNKALWQDQVAMQLKQVNLSTRVECFEGNWRTLIRTAVVRLGSKLTFDR